MQVFKRTTQRYTHIIHYSSTSPTISPVLALAAPKSAPPISDCISACILCNLFCEATSPNAASSNVDISSSLPTVSANSIVGCAVSYNCLAVSTVNPAFLSSSNLANDCVNPLVLACACNCNVCISPRNTLSDISGSTNAPNIVGWSISTPYLSLYNLSTSGI